ncbi:hypothetical protein DFJ58DRAFT_837744 [Suillus subalutaceus]|uniref:uncharacterized protein n=1 Tax=Suillus subalutaceus TaxID=48586 RepID=UPI001B863160|nr:uncharacterized protein DFJ58DRAFT_837744 [Suillus subalutaceus]KAG1869449.1 hypothetical protein DFJ58DRAFT_837744 [Suillus subalutaceus]
MQAVKSVNRTRNCLLRCHQSKTAPIASDKKRACEKDGPHSERIDSNIAGIWSQYWNDHRSQEEINNSPDTIDDIRTVKEWWTKIPAPKDVNTFLTVSFSVNGGGGSVKFDMILFDWTGEGEKWCLRTAAMLCMGIIFLYLAHSEPKIKYYAFYAGAHAIVIGTFRLLASRSIYRNALAKKNEAMKPQSSAETAHETTGTEGILEDAKPRGVSENADLLV